MRSRNAATRQPYSLLPGSPGSQELFRSRSLGVRGRPPAHPGHPASRRLSQIVGMAISVATEAVLTVGLATPLIIEQVATRVSSLATRIGTSVTRLLTSFTSFSGLFEALQELLRKGKTLFDRLPPGRAGVRALHAETPPSYTGAPLPSAPVKATGGTRPLFPDSFDPYPGQSVEEFRSFRTEWRPRRAPGQRSGRADAVQRIRIDRQVTQPSSFSNSEMSTAMVV